jgi:hypothetical protein
MLGPFLNVECILWHLDGQWPANGLTISLKNKYGLLGVDISGGCSAPGNAGVV